VTGDHEHFGADAPLEYVRADVPEHVTVGEEIVVATPVAAGLIGAQLESLFGDDDELEAIALSAPDIDRGYVLRTDFLDSLVPGIKGFDDMAGVGGSDQLFLPGDVNVEPLRFVCPKDGQEVTVLFLGPSGVVMCPVHPGVAMERHVEP
jgi:hypothetical protein